jgi:hypothetical protein
MLLMADSPEQREAAGEAFTNEQPEDKKLCP